MEPIASAEVYIALGSNLGDSLGILRQATRQLAAWSDLPMRASSIWSSSPVDCPHGSPRFLNAMVVIHVKAEMSATAFLERTQALEREYGRRKKQVMNEARPLDLDIIDWNQEIIQSPALILPHPRAHQRRFVLAPLAELAPTRILPGQHQTVKQLLENLVSEETLWPIPETLLG